MRVAGVLSSSLRRAAFDLGKGNAVTAPSFRAKTAGWTYFMLIPSIISAPNPSRPAL
jgi:hypothetical protein